MSVLGERAVALSDYAEDIHPAYFLTLSVQASLVELEKEGYDIREVRDEKERFHHNPIDTIVEWNERGWLDKCPRLSGAVARWLDAAEKQVARVTRALASSADVLDVTNTLISQRTRYGQRTEIAEAPSTVLVWSNASAEWYSRGGCAEGRECVSGCQRGPCTIPADTSTPAAYPACETSTIRIQF